MALRDHVQKLLPALLVGIFGAICVSSLLQKSSTWDETHYLGTGRAIVAERSWDVPDANLHPPLTYFVHSLPLFCFSIPSEILESRYSIDRGQSLMALRPDDAMLNSSRIALLVFALGIPLLVFLWARRLYGLHGALLAQTVTCFSPNLIAHARLITPDITLTTFLLASCYCLWRRQTSANGRRHLAITGLAIGLMLLSKYTGLLALAALVVTDMTVRGVRRPLPGLRDIASFAKDWAAILLIAFAVLWCGYGFHVGYAEIGDLSIPLPMPTYVEGILFQLDQSKIPHNFYFLGQYSNTGWWYFYVVLAAIKLPVGTLLFLIALAPVCRWFGIRFERSELYLLAPVILITLYLSSLNTIHNGIRYWLPVYPLLLVLIGKLGGVAVRGGVARLAVWIVALSVPVSSLASWPNYIPYTNELFGGSSRAFALLSDSNVDWGQDLKLLKRYMVENDIAKVRFAYFGSADPAHYGIEYEYMPSPNSGLRPLPSSPPRATHFALSVHHYNGVGFEKKDFYARYHELEPEALIGGSIFLFDLSRVPPSRR